MARLLLRTSSFTKHVTACEMNNAAVKLFREGKDDESFALYKQSLSLLTEAARENSTTPSPYEDRLKPFPTLCSFSISAIEHLDRPLQLACNESMQTSEDSAALIVLYNLFLLLRRSGNNQDAMSFLDLVQTLVEEQFDETTDLHPSFRMSIRCHLEEMAYERGTVEEAWTYFIEAIEIGEGTMGHEMLFAKVCTRLGCLLLREGYRNEANAVYTRAARIYEHLPTSMTLSLDSGSASWEGLEEIVLFCDTMTAPAA